MNKITALFLSFFLPILAQAEVIRGATLREVNTRAEDGLVSILNFLKVIFVVVGFGLFGGAIIRLQKITKGEIQGASPWSALLGMVVAAMMSAIGVFWIVTSNTLKKFFGV